jgi:superfamily II DNA or RNA helicase
MLLRDYQERIVSEALALIGSGKHPLIEMATGTGKTRTACELIKRLPGRRMLWLAHRRELIRQAADTIEAVTGEWPGIEMRKDRAGKARIVVASKDTVRVNSRLIALATPDVIVTDETHHSSAQTYRRIYDAFPNAIRVGLSATPYRTDKRTLWMYDTATSPYGILRAIDDGWLTPIEARRVYAEHVDLSGVSVTAGDLSEHDLALVMEQERAIAEVVDGVLSLYAERPTIVYASSIASAEAYVTALNRRVELVSRLVTGQTGDDQRAAAFRDFGVTYKVLVNVGVATEGVDLPRAAVIAIARPTKSRSLFLQMLGRGLRPLPGVDGAADRRAWIAASAKPACCVLDFVGSVGRHKIQNVAAAIGGSPEASARIEREMARETISVLDALKRESEREARKAIADGEAERLRKQAKGDARAQIASELADIVGAMDTGHESETPTDRQLATLLEHGYAGAPRTRAEAASAISRIREHRGLATQKQVSFVAKWYPGVAVAHITKQQASRLISQKIDSWKRRRLA